VAARLLQVVVFPWLFFHGVNTSSNPVGDANFLNSLAGAYSLTRYGDPQAKRYPLRFQGM